MSLWAYSFLNPNNNNANSSTECLICKSFEIKKSSLEYLIQKNRLKEIDTTWYEDKLYKVKLDFNEHIQLHLK